MAQANEGIGRSSVRHRIAHGAEVRLSNAKNRCARTRGDRQVHTLLDPFTS
jgi:hypothetical protein